MSDVKISQLPASTTPLAGTELVPIVQGGVTKQATVNQFGAGVGYLPAGTGAVNTTVQAKLRESVSVKDFGPITGVDDTAVIQLAAASGKTDILIPEGNCVVAENTTIPSSINLSFDKGGFITVVSGVTLKIQGSIDAGDYVIFKGAGTVQLIEGTSYHNLAWYEGNSLDQKWDFCRRGLANLSTYTAYIPKPQKDDPAAISVGVSPQRWAWKLDAPLQFDDPENRGEWTVDGNIVATTAMTSMMLFSPTNKTEDITFRTNVLLDCNNLASYGVNIQGGARINFDEQLYVLNCVRAVNIYSSLPVSGNYFANIYCGSFSDSVVRIEGVSGTAALNNVFGTINTEVATSASASCLKVIGDVRDLKVESVFYNKDVAGVTIDSGVYIEGNSSVRPNAVNIGVIYGIGMATGLKTRLASGSTKIRDIKVGYVSPNALAATSVDLEYLTDSQIEAIGSGHTEIISATATEVVIPKSGSWTPVIEGQTSAGVGTYTTQIGRYQNVGDMTFFTGVLVWTAHTGTGNFLIKGLPNASANINANFGWPLTTFHSSLVVAAGKALGASLLNNSTEIRLYAMDPSGGGTVQIAIDAAGLLYLSGFYQRSTA